MNVKMTRRVRVPLRAVRALRKLGRDMGTARRRRRIQAAILAERASISRTTLHKIEKGDPGVSAGAYAAVLLALGLDDRLGDVADPGHDDAGLALDEEQLPKRIRLSAPASSPGRNKR